MTTELFQEYDKLVEFVVALRVLLLEQGGDSPLVIPGQTACLGAAQIQVPATLIISTFSDNTGKLVYNNNHNI